jgi:hypothetical protein
MLLITVKVNREVNFFAHIFIDRKPILLFLMDCFELFEVLNKNFKESEIINP